jgi:hypothetical protein
MCWYLHTRICSVSSCMHYFRFMEGINASLQTQIGVLFLNSRVYKQYFWQKITGRNFQHFAYSEIDGVWGCFRAHLRM